MLHVRVITGGMPPKHGAPHPVTPEWRAQVVARLRELGRSQEWLAEQCGCSAPAISDIIKGKRGSSRYVPQIHRALGWDPPAPITPRSKSPIVAELVAKANLVLEVQGTKRGEKQLRAILAILESTLSPEEGE